MTVFNQKTSQALSALGNRQDARLIRQALEFSTLMRLTFAELNAQYAPSPSRAGTYSRNDPVVLAAQAGMSLTNAQVDSLFMLAASK